MKLFDHGKVLDEWEGVIFGRVCECVCVWGNGEFSVASFGPSYWWTMLKGGCGDFHVLQLPCIEKAHVSLMQPDKYLSIT